MELAPPTLQDVKNLRATALDSFDKLMYRFCTLLCSKPQLDIMFSDKILRTLQPIMLQYTFKEDANLFQRWKEYEEWTCSDFLIMAALLAQVHTIKFHSQDLLKSTEMQLPISVITVKD